MSTTARQQTPQSTAPSAQFQKSLGDYWRYYTDKGQQLHNRGMVNEATHYFLEAVRVSEALIFDETHQNNDQYHNGIEMYYTASHNLASCYNYRAQGQKGETVLRECYEQIIALAKATHYSREIRLESLCVLERALFSLTSQLAYMNKPTEIHTLIKTTDTIVTQLQTQLGIE